MKKILLTISILTFANICHAQFEWLGRGNGVKSYDLTSTKGHVLLRQEGYFTAINSLGINLYEFPDYNSTDTTQAVEIVELLDSSFIFFYWDISATAMLGYDAGITINSDWVEGSGNYLFCSSNCGEEYRSVPFDNSSIIKYGRFSSFNSIVEKLSILDGQSIWEKNFNGTTFYYSTVLGNHIFICTNNGLWKLDGDGNIAQQWQGPAFEKILPFTETSFLVQHGDTLVHFSEGLEPLDTVVVPQGPIEDWDIRNGQLGVLNANDLYWVYDLNMDEVGSFSLSGPGLDFQKTQVSDGSLFLAGNFTYGPSISYTSGLFINEYSIQDGSDLTTPKDIGVLDVNKTFGASIFQQGGKYYVQYDTVFVTVKNFGDSAISSFLLKPAYYPPTTPGNYTYAASRTFSNISPSLAPGESRTFAWTGLKFAFDGPPSGEAFDICMISSYPNNGIDVDSSNDVSCTTFLVGTEQTLEQRSVISAYPNPARDLVTVVSETPLPTNAIWSLHDQFGRTAQNVLLPTGYQKVNLSLDGLSAGLYFWQVLVAGNQVGNGKLAIVK